MVLVVWKPKRHTSCWRVARGWHTKARLAGEWLYYPARRACRPQCLLRERLSTSAAGVSRVGGDNGMSSGRRLLSLRRGRVWRVMRGGISGTCRCRAGSVVMSDTSLEVGFSAGQLTVFSRYKSSLRYAISSKFVLCSISEMPTAAEPVVAVLRRRKRNNLWLFVLWQNRMLESGLESIYINFSLSAALWKKRSPSRRPCRMLLSLSSKEILGVSGFCVDMAIDRRVGRTIRPREH